MADEIRTPEQREVGGVEPHLESAARGLERILNARDPECVYIVSVMPRGAAPPVKRTA
jgi:hypothetical protein